MIKSEEKALPKDEVETKNKEQNEEKKENIYSDIDDMLNHTLKSDNE